jgi:hypothetical protein
MSSPERDDLVRLEVWRLLDRSRACRAPPAEGREQIARNTFAVAAVLMEAERMDHADFPVFVKGAQRGVFEAIVNASVEQMQAYADLIADVAKSVDQFREDTVTDRTRPWLARPTCSWPQAS